MDVGRHGNGAELLQKVHGGAHGHGFAAEQGQVTVGGQAGHLPLFQQGGGQLRIVATGGQLQQVVVRVAALQDDPALAFAAAAAGHL